MRCSVLLGGLLTLPLSNHQLQPGPYFINCANFHINKADG
jgi:hypothetical protein